MDHDFRRQDIYPMEEDHIRRIVEHDFQQDDIYLGEGNRIGGKIEREGIAQCGFLSKQAIARRKLDKNMMKQFDRHEMIFGRPIIRYY